MIQTSHVQPSFGPALAMLFEQNTGFHWVPTAGQKWPRDMPLAWNGISNGHWEGDTLVVETTGFNGHTRLDTADHPLSKQLKRGGAAAGIAQQACGR